MYFSSDRIWSTEKRGEFKKNKEYNRNILIESTLFKKFKIILVGWTFLTNFRLFMYGDWLDIPGWIMTGCKTQENILAAAGFYPIKKEESFKQNKK